MTASRSARRMTPSDVGRPDSSMAARIASLSRVKVWCIRKKPSYEATAKSVSLGDPDSKVRRRSSRTSFRPCGWMAKLSKNRTTRAGGRSTSPPGASAAAPQSSM